MVGRDEMDLLVVTLRTTKNANLVLQRNRTRVFHFLGTQEAAAKRHKTRFSLVTETFLISIQICCLTESIG